MVFKYTYEPEINIEEEMLRLEKSLGYNRDEIEKARRKPMGHVAYTRMTPKGKVVYIQAKGTVRPKTVKPIESTNSQKQETDSKKMINSFIDFWQQMSRNSLSAAKREVKNNFNDGTFQIIEHNKEKYILVNNPGYINDGEVYKYNKEADYWDFALPEEREIIREKVREVSDFEKARRKPNGSR